MISFCAYACLYKGGGGNLGDMYSIILNLIIHMEKIILKNARFSGKGRQSLHIYSRASDNGPSEKRTTSLQRTSAVLPIEFSIVIVH